MAVLSRFGDPGGIGQTVRKTSRHPTMWRDFRELCRPPPRRSVSEDGGFE